MQAPSNRGDWNFVVFRLLGFGSGLPQTWMRSLDHEDEADDDEIILVAKTSLR